MHDAFGVCRFERICELHAECQHRLDIEWTTTNAIAERLTVQQLHNNEMFGLVLLDPVNRADVWMIESGGRACLALKTLQQAGVSSECGCQEFQSNVAAKVGVFSFIDNSHPAFAKLRRDVIVRDVPAKHGDVS